MELLVDRKWKKETYTIGKLYVNGVEFSDTLEDKDRGLTSNMSPEDIKKKKVYGETAIPTGDYTVSLTYSPKFATRSWGIRYNGKVPQINNVNGFSGVRIHPLNKPNDTYGCIGIGRNSAKGVITDSSKYYFKLLDNYIIPALKKGETISLTIR